MVFKTTSVKEVIARIIRNTGKSLSAEYIEDMLEWIPEGIKKLKTKYTLVDAYQEIEIEGHTGVLPCNIIGLLAVEYNGYRIREGGDIRNLASKSALFLSRGNSPEIWEKDTITQKNYNPDTFPDNSYNEEVRGLDIVKIPDSVNSDEYYKINLGCIQTSFECGTIVVHYKALPTCEDGYPLVPDNENYKTALYWYVLMMMLGAGYEHKVFNYNHAYQEWEIYARRAISEIKYPTVDRMERVYRAWARLVPPEHFYEDFRIGSEQIQPIVK